MSDPKPCSECGCENAEQVLAAALREAQAREAVLQATLLDVAGSSHCWCLPDREPATTDVNGHADYCADAQAVVASPSAAAAELLRRVEELEAEQRDCGGPVHCKGGAAKDRADRDRWLGHARRLVRLLETPEVDRGAAWDDFFAARRDLGHHDGRGT